MKFACYIPHSTSGSLNIHIQAIWSLRSIVY